VQVQAALDVSEIQAGQLANAPEAVAQCAAVNDKCFGGQVVVAPVVEVLRQRFDEGGVPAGVICDQRPQPVGDVGVDLAALLSDGQDAVDAEILEHGDPVRCA
jgi:hypothetical protein